MPGLPELAPAAAAALALVVGLLVGSFLNVVIHRLPIMLERQWREQCAKSSAAGAAPEPSERYPLIELLCGLLTAAVVWRFGVAWTALGALLVTWFLIALAGIDLDHQLLPDSLTLPLLWGGLLASLGWSASTATSLPVSPTDAIVGAAAGYLSLWSVYHLFRMCTGKEGMGFGDFKLLAALGAWLGWRMLLPIVLCSAAVGAVVGITLIVTARRGRGVPLPFGPFLAAAGWLAMMWGPQWVDSYLGLYGHG